jgi:hypothetical protein
MIYERRSRRPGQDSAASKPVVMDCDHHSGVAGWKRRHRAARRVISLDCGCPDPWPCRCSEPPLSDKMIDAGRDGALHLLADGYVPLLKIEVLQALYRRGGDDRELAELLHTLTDEALA